VIAPGAHIRLSRGQPHRQQDKCWASITCITCLIHYEIQSLKLPESNNYLVTTASLTTKFKACCCTHAQYPDNLEVRPRPAQIPNSMHACHTDTRSVGHGCSVHEGNSCEGSRGAHIRFGCSASPRPTNQSCNSTMPPQHAHKAYNYSMH
jgi:hypothetical protein